MGKYFALIFGIGMMCISLVMGQEAAIVTNAQDRIIDIELSHAQPGQNAYFRTKTERGAENTMFLLPGWDDAFWDSYKQTVQSITHLPILHAPAELLRQGAEPFLKGCVIERLEMAHSPVVQAIRAFKDISNHLNVQHLDLSDLNYIPLDAPGIFSGISVPRLTFNRFFIPAERFVHPQAFDGLNDVIALYTDPRILFTDAFVKSDLCKKVKIFGVAERSAIPPTIPLLSTLIAAADNIETILFPNIPDTTESDFLTEGEIRTFRKKVFRVVNLRRDDWSILKYGHSVDDFIGLQYIGSYGSPFAGNPGPGPFTYDMDAPAESAAIDTAVPAALPVPANVARSAGRNEGAGWFASLRNWIGRLRRR